MSIHLGVALARTRGAFDEHWDETLLVAGFKRHRSTGKASHNSGMAFSP